MVAPPLKLSCKNNQVYANVCILKCQFMLYSKPIWPVEGQMHFFVVLKAEQ